MQNKGGIAGEVGGCGWKLIGGGSGEGWKTYFHIFKNIQFACSQINLLYLDHGVFDIKPTNRAARKKSWEGQIPCKIKQEITNCSSCEEVLTLI